jgi:hypothetical protein
MNWNSNSWLQSNKPSFNPTAAKMAKKSPENWKKSEILLSSRGVILAKINQSHRNANWNSNFWLQSNTPSFNLITVKMTPQKVWKTVNDHGRMDGQCHNIIRPVFPRAYKNRSYWKKKNLQCINQLLVMKWVPYPSQT